MKTDDTYMRTWRRRVSVDDIDFVMCTHLHADHVGWNTRLQTAAGYRRSPNARYVFATEFDY
jgi:glyoxylase-like metal-dependent hydrolase (beta-lactamase superfamily II)